jgi:hypothetical protein
MPCCSSECRVTSTRELALTHSSRALCAFIKADFESGGRTGELEVAGRRLRTRFGRVLLMAAPHRTGTDNSPQGLGGGICAHAPVRAPGGR